MKNATISFETSKADAILIGKIVRRAMAFKVANYDGMTYCRGGAAILAAGEAGKKLKDATSFEFAAMMIYKASSPIKVSPVRFYEDNEAAMKDIERCAIEEKEAQ